MSKLLVNSQRVKVGARFGKLTIIGNPFSIYGKTGNRVPGVALTKPARQKRCPR